jgi:hypothetical protein
MRIVTKNSGSAVANRIKLRISVDELNDVKNIGPIAIQPHNEVIHTFAIPMNSDTCRISQTDGNRFNLLVEGHTKGPLGTITLTEKNKSMTANSNASCRIGPSEQSWCLKSAKPKRRSFTSTATPVEDCELKSSPHCRAQKPPDMIAQGTGEYAPDVTRTLWQFRFDRKCARRHFAVTIRTKMFLTREISLGLRPREKDNTQRLIDFLAFARGTLVALVISGRRTAILLFAAELRTGRNL